MKVEVIPQNKKWNVKAGINLGELLRDKIGFELPCGGRGQCGKCRIKLISGDISITDSMRREFSEEKLDQGYRLACKSIVKENIKVKLLQSKQELPRIEKKHTQTEETATQYGIAIDAGSTTIAGSIIDLNRGVELYTITLGNEQKKYGSDIMSRLDYIQKNDPETLRKSLKRSIYKVVNKLSNKVNDNIISTINIVGNTFIHHTFCGYDTQQLITSPYEPDSKKQVSLTASELDWEIKGNPTINILPVLDGFVGSDILAGIFANDMYTQDENCLLIDLGTNGEIVAGNAKNLLFASTAAGPAFEGGNIKMGMRARKGAITKVDCQEEGQISATVMGEEQPKGICGSGLLDAIACGLKSGKISSSGNILSESREFVIQDPVKLVQNDIREVQLAQGALSAGIEILLDELHLTKDDISKVYLAGAFGNYINEESAIKTGLLDFEADKIINAGNTALKGAIKSLYSEDYKKIIEKGRYVDLSTHKSFQDLFIKKMTFPE